jgi:outer membrane protein OmpA-like peptidoglycan-associated protein
MAISSIYQSNASETPIIRKWVLLGLLISIAIHLGFYVVSRMTTLERFSTQPTTRLVPRQFKVQQLAVDEDLLNQQDQASAKPEEEVNSTPNIPLPSEENLFEKEFEEVVATPNAPTDVERPILNEKPKIDSNAMSKLTKLQADSEASMQRALDSVDESLIKDIPKVISGSQFQLPVGDSDMSTFGQDAKGYSDLDTLLAQSGGLKEGTAPVLLPTDLLFDYDSAELRPAALGSLIKLGKLISRNPKVIFTIEGHADSFGKPEYNMALSKRRAASVKRWLVSSMGLDPKKIETIGFGSTQPIVPTSGTVEEQQMNRRVEIVMEFP